MKPHDTQAFIDEAAKKAVDVLKEVFSQRLVMAALYGSAVTGTYAKEVSDINILAAVSSLTAEDLNRTASLGKKKLSSYRITPLVLTVEELENSSDVFPVEYLEIKETMKLLYGSSLFDSIDPGRQNIRHQVETMTRGALNALRQIILLSSESSRTLSRELKSWSGRQLPLLKALLRLSENKPDPQRYVEQAEELLGCSLDSLKQVKSLRDGSISREKLKQLALSLEADYARMAEAVDAFETN
jgi:predicted nucleotidyltransferase